MISIQIDTTRGLSSDLLEVISMLEGKELSELNQVGGYASANAAKSYHHAFSNYGGWRGSRYLSTSQRGKWGQDVADSWSFKGSSPDGATIGNEHPHYPIKVHGGTIRPTRAQHLTIPLIAEAKGLRVADYEIQTGSRLFAVKGHDALFQKDGETARAVYALKKQVTVPAWTGALPEEELLADAFTESWLNAFRDKIDS